MTTVRLAAFLFLTAAPAIAQNYLPGQLHRAINPAINTPDGSASISRPPAIPATAFAPHRVIDKKFIIAMGALGGAETLRFTSRKLVLDHEFAAGAPWVTAVPSNQHLVAKDAASTLRNCWWLMKSRSPTPGFRVTK